MNSPYSLTIISIVGSLAGYVAKQTFIVYKIHIVQEEIAHAVSLVARSYFNNFTASAGGYLAGVFLAFPVTNILGDIIWTSISYGVTCIARAIGEAAGFYEKSISYIRSYQILAIKVVGIALGYIVKSFFVIYGMREIHLTLQKLTPLITLRLCSNSFLAYIIKPLSSLAVTSLTPNITAAIGDIVGVVVQILFTEGSIYLLNWMQPIPNSPSNEKLIEKRGP
jgi:hypothetical protein